VIALDTNLLVYAHRRDVREHKAAHYLVEQAVVNSSGGYGICWPSIPEFWSVVTAKTAAGGATPPEEAERFIRGLFEGTSVQVWLPSRDLPLALARNATQFAVAGRRIFDLQIALIALENGADEIWTHDGDFIRFPGLRIHDPLT